MISEERIYSLRVFSLTWKASMLMYWNKRGQLPKNWLETLKRPQFHCFGAPIWPPMLNYEENVYTRKEFNFHRTGLKHQFDRRFIVLEHHQYGCRGIM